MSLKNNSFTHNTALTAGGGINWINERYIDLGNNYRTNNSAHYGPFESCYPDRLEFEFISNNDPFEPSGTTGRLLSVH